jgi:MoaA/NifB/PqqE/SkfB family radical SAM enzyme
MKKHRKLQLMDFKLYQKIIDEIALENPSARVWQIFFGDPFMCYDIAKRIVYAKQKNLSDVVLNSNGVLMSRNRAQAVIEAGLDSMYVGIDAATEVTYDRIRVGGNFKKAIKNVLKYRDLLEEIGRPDQKLFVQFVVSEMNEDEVESFKRFWVNEGVNVKIRPKISWAGLIQADNLQDNTAVDRKPCYWLMQTMNICADGRVALCSVDIHCRVECGNVKYSSLKSLWQGLLKEYRTMHKECRFEELPEMCHQCEDWQSAYADFVAPNLNS